MVFNNVKWYKLLGKEVVDPERSFMEIAESWVGIEFIAEYLGVNQTTIRNWIKAKRIPAHRIGRQWKFKLSEIETWIISGESAIE
jgi:excisionase family DNA binding protein